MQTAPRLRSLEERHAALEDRLFAETHRPKPLSLIHI